MLSGDLWQTGGTTKIVELKDGVPWQTIRIFSRHSVILEHNDNIQLQGNVNYAMVKGDYIKLIQKDDRVWYEIQRGGAAASSSGSSNPAVIGVDDFEVGTLVVYGGGAGADGGVLKLYMGSDDDTSAQYYSIQVVGEDLYLGPATDTDSFMHNLSSGAWEVRGGILYIGQNDVLNGTVVAFSAGGASSQGGQFQAYTAPNHDGSHTYYGFAVSSDDLLIGPSSNSDALKYDGGNNRWEFTVALLGTTIDASVDFTVGGTVITDATITDDGILSIVPTTSLDVKGASIVNIGTLDSVLGYILLHAEATGNTGGGAIDFSTAEDYDTAIQYYRVQALEDDFFLGPSSDTDSLKYDGGNNRWEFTTDVVTEKAIRGFSYNFMLGG